jgi:t-SNARE complex subunit (syntaxin)
MADLFGDQAVGGDVEMATPNSNPSHAPDGAGYACVFAETNVIKADVGKINNAADQINKLADRFHLASTTDAEKKIQEEEQSIRASMKPVCNKAKEKLKALKAKLKDTNMDHSERKMRENLFRALAQSFVDAVKNYQGAQAGYEANIRNQLGRRLKIVSPEMTDSQVENIIDSGRAQQIFESVIKDGKGSSQIAASYKDVMSQHEDIKALEKSILELMDMFQDMALLIEQQGETLNSVEEQVNKANDYVESGTKALGRANKSQKSKRKYMCCCVIIGLAVLMAILLPVLLATSSTTT